MSTKIHKTMLAISFAIVAILTSAIPAAAQSNYYNLRIENNTRYNIYQIRFSSVNQTYWPPDLLGASKVFSDETSLTITNISPGRYDIAFIDEDSDVCVLQNVAIYQNLNWNLSQRWLLNCERWPAL